MSLWANGAKNMATVLKKITPLKSAYAEAKNLAESVFISFTGPIPVKIIEAL